MVANTIYSGYTDNSLASYLPSDQESFGYGKFTSNQVLQERGGGDPLSGQSELSVSFAVRNRTVAVRVYPATTDVLLQACSYTDP